MVIHNLSGVEKAYAKINLYLDVIGKRSDGYHDILGLFQTVNLFDEVDIQLVDQPGVSVVSNVKIEGKNLVVKAYEIFSKHYKPDFGISVRLNKKIPIGGGLGGGSSDAAAVLRFLARVCNIPKTELTTIAIEVGSDVPFLILGGTAIVEGKGDKLTFLEPISGYSVNLFCPNVSISTKEAYSSLSTQDFLKGPKPVAKLYEAYIQRDFQKIRSLSYNIFEKVMVSKHAEIAELIKKAWQEKPVVAMMTGSGSCVFAVHGDERAAYKFVDTVENGGVRR